MIQRWRKVSKSAAIYKREIRSLFFSPVAYISIALFMFLVSLMVTSNIYQASMREVFSSMSLFLIFVVPMATMRVLSEEMRMGTNELLLTSPVSLAGIVLAKFFAVMTLMGAIFLLSGEYVLMLAQYGKPDWGPIITGYIGLLLLCSAFVSIGVFASSLTKNQFISAVVTFVIMLFFIIIDSLSNMFTLPGVSDILEQISIFKHYEDFFKGVLNLSNFIYYIGFTFIFLFLTVRNLETKRW